MPAADSNKVRFWIQIALTVAVTVGGGFMSYVLSGIKDQLSESKTQQTKLADKVDDMNTGLTKVSTTLTEGAMTLLQSQVKVNADQQVEINSLKDRIGVAEGDLKELRAYQNLRLPGKSQ
jgi:hypothetical protein